MNDYNQLTNTSNPQDENLLLAQWLRQLLTITPEKNTDTSMPTQQYHPRFYQQIPDFVTALIKNDPQAMVHYTPLLFHLIGCSACHSAYLEIYDAMQTAINSSEAATPVQISSTSPTWATIPPRIVQRLCKLLISQAEEALNREDGDKSANEALARSLLQQALSISAHIMQSSVRQQALSDLMHVALLADSSMKSIEEQGPAAHSYQALASSGSGTRHGKTWRRVEHPSSQPIEQPAIHLRSGSLEGHITQNGDLLELELEKLDEKLRGHYLSIFVPLGTLIEPVQWIGGNPYAIRSLAPVDEQGTLKTPLGKTTSLRLSKLEDHNLLEAMFQKLDVRRAD